MVFLHGWGGAWQSWAPVVEKLESKYTIYALDLPGFGLSTLSRAYDLADYVEEIHKFIQKEILDPARMTKKVVLIGHSFGGQVALKFALTHPEMLDGLVLVDAAGVRKESWKVQVARLGSLGILRNFGILRKFGRNLLGSEDYLKVTGLLRETLKKISGEDLTSEFHKIKLPTLLFWGEKDKATPLKWGEILHSKISNSKLVIVPGGGHFSYLDDQELFVENLHEFITNLHK